MVCAVFATTFEQALWSTTLSSPLMSLRESCLRELREVRTRYYLLGERLLDLEERIASLEIGEADLIYLLWNRP